MLSPLYESCVLVKIMFRIQNIQISDLDYYIYFSLTNEIPTIPKKLASGILVKTSAANAAYNPLTDQYINEKCIYLHFPIGFLVHIGIIPRLIVKSGLATKINHHQWHLPTSYQYYHIACMQESYSS